jgi:DNA modification methylase
MGFKYVPCVYVDLDKQNEKALNIALNKVQGLWDDDALKTIFEEMKSIEPLITGFTDQEIKKYVDIKVQPENEIKKNKWDVKIGDKYIINGIHYVMCGDSTCVDHVKKLLGNTCVDQLLTDPHYGINYSNKSKALHKYKKGGRTESEGHIKNDTGLDYRNFFKSFLEPIQWSQYNTAYIFMLGLELVNLSLAFLDIGGSWGDYLIWQKNHSILCRKDYNTKHEFIFYGWVGKHKFYGPTNASAIMDYKHPNINPLHPHQKPLEIISRLISDGSQKGAVLYDPFGGSGSVLIAAHQTERISYTMELMPHYVDIILNRAQGQNMDVVKYDT